jgi:hypothetical protein
MQFTVPTQKRPEDTLSPVLSALIDEALVRTSREEYEKGRGSGQGQVALHRIGSGYIGVECGRALAFKFHKQPVEEREKVYVTPGELQRHAEAGHWTEAKTAQWLRLAGFTLLTEKADGRQFGYMSCPDANGQFQIAGELDGVFTAGPTSAIPYPCLWESKKATDKKFTKFSKEGVAKADPKYHGQLQTNMFEMKVYVTLFTMLNLDTMKYYCEIVRFDPKVAQALQDRAANVIASSCPEEIPRITNNPSDFRCKFCDYQRRCWNKDKPAAPPAAPVPFFLASSQKS